MSLRDDLEPLGQGLFNGKIDRDHPPQEGTRQGSTWTEPHVPDRERLCRIIDVLREVINETGRSLPQVALAWVRDRPNVDTLVLAARTEVQLADNLASIDFVLTPEQAHRIEEAGRPAANYPLWHRAPLAQDRPSPSEGGYLKAGSPCRGWANNVLDDRAGAGMVSVAVGLPCHLVVPRAASLTRSSPISCSVALHIETARADVVIDLSEDRTMPTKGSSASELTFSSLVSGQPVEHHCG